MGTTAQKLNRVLQTKSDLKTVINYSGANITNETTFKDYPKLLNKAYIDILNDEGESLYNALPKTTGTGSNLTLNAEEGKMKITLKGDTQQEGTPTPSNPQNVEVVTGGQTVKIVGKNLLYSNLTYPFTTKGVTVTQEEDGSITLNGTQTGAFNLTYNNHYYNDIKDYEGKTITISLNATGTGGFRNFGIKRQTSPDLLIATSPVTNRSAILDLKGYTDIWFDIYFNNTSRTFVNYNIKPQIEVGSQATTYEPYQSQNYPINLGKNLFDKDNANIINGWFDTNTTVLTSNTNTRTLYIKCLPNTTYTITKLISLQFNIGCTNNLPSIGTIVQKVETGPIGNYDSNVKVNYTYTTNNTAQYLLVRYAYSTQVDLDLMISSIQIEKGSTATDYAPYITPLEYCKIGDYADQFFKNTTNSEFYDSTLELNEWYLKKSIGKYIFTGNENLSSYGTIGGYSIDNIINAYSVPSSSYPVGKCTISEMIRRISIYDGSLEGISYNNTQIFLRYANKTQEEILSLLANNELYYALATPQYIHISETDYPTLRSQLENIYNNAKSYDGQTNITQTNDDLSFNLEVSALAKIE